MPERLAVSISRTVASRTWLTLPGAEPSSPLNMVWIESTTTTSGATESIICRIASTSTSETTSRCGETVARRLLRRRIWRIDSSPDT